MFRKAGVKKTHTFMIISFTKDELQFKNIEITSCNIILFLFSTISLVTKMHRDAHDAAIGCFILIFDRKDTTKTFHNLYV